jgi:glutathione S-transferase
VIVLHGTVVSPFVRKVRVFCLEKGIPFETSELSPAEHAARLRAMSPLGKIPILEEDGELIPDSSVICLYLERARPSPPLLPEAPRDYARALFLDEWADTKAPEAFHPALVERLIAPRLLGREPDEARVARARSEAAPPILDWLEKQLGLENQIGLERQAGEGAGLVGGRFGLADCAVGAQLQSWALAGEAIDAARWPRVRAYADAILARPSFRAMEQALARQGWRRAGPPPRPIRP